MAPPRNHPQRITVKDKVLGFYNLYLKTPLDRKLDLQFKSYRNVIFLVVPLGAPMGPTYPIFELDLTLE